jgi:hypothetical protein
MSERHVVKTILFVGRRPLLSTHPQITIPSWLCHPILWKHKWSIPHHIFSVICFYSSSVPHGLVWPVSTSCISSHAFISFPIWLKQILVSVIMCHGRVCYYALRELQHVIPSTFYNARYNNKKNKYLSVFCTNVDSSLILFISGPSH